MQRLPARRSPGHAAGAAPARAVADAPMTMPGLVEAEAEEGPETGLRFHWPGLAWAVAAAGLMRRSCRIAVSGVESMP